MSGTKPSLYLRAHENVSTSEGNGRDFYRMLCSEDDVAACGLVKHDVIVPLAFGSGISA